MCACLKILMKIGISLVFVAAAVALAYRCLYSGERYSMTETFGRKPE